MALSFNETEAVLQRDAEDANKLAAGIAKAVSKGVLEEVPSVEPTRKIDVLGKSADAVAEEIIGALGSAAKSGCILVLTGLSGTGKGTTVSKLQAALPNAASWSNGNIFRALTLLAVTHCEKSGVAFSVDVLTQELLQTLMSYLEFGKFNGCFDTKIAGYGYECLVSEVANTVLKEPKVSKNIPTVAEMTQGEVVQFAAKAAEQMRADGMNVLMEGRSQTLDYIRTPHRFELTLFEPIIIGIWACPVVALWLRTVVFIICSFAFGPCRSFVPHAAPRPLPCTPEAAAISQKPCKSCLLVGSSQGCLWHPLAQTLARHNALSLEALFLLQSAKGCVPWVPAPGCPKDPSF